MRMMELATQLYSMDIQPVPNGARNIFVADMDGDGDLDGVSASHNDDTIAWYENHGAAGNHY